MRHVATFKMSGESGTLLLATRRETATELTEQIEAADAFDRPFFQIDESAIAYSYAGDPVSVAVSIYTATLSEKLPAAEAKQAGHFHSKGERVFMGSIMSLGFEEHCPSFFLRAGRYKLSCLAWNLARGCDEASPRIEDLLAFQHHAMVFRA